MGGNQRAATLRADSLLLLTALIWGFAFVAQRTGMRDMGPFAFNGVRFALGAAVLLPLVHPTSDLARDLPDLQARFEGVTGRRVRI